MNLDIVSVEQALVLGKWNVESTQGTSTITDLARDAVNGNFGRVLTSSHAKDFLTITSFDGDHILEHDLAEWFDISSKDTSSAELELRRLVIAVTLLHAFIQANWTGPNLDFAPLDVLTVPNNCSHSITEEILQHRSAAELAYGGEPAYHLANVLIYLRLAKILFDVPYKFCQSAPWWRLRTWLVHQQVLDEPSAVPSDVLVSLEPLTETIATDGHLAGRLMVEEGLLEHHLSHDRTAAEFFVRAAHKTQLQYELTGALGKRTKFQQFEVSQLVLLAESHLKDNEDVGSDKPEMTVGESTDQPDANGSSITENNSSSTSVPETLALNDDTLLEQTQFTSSNPTSAADSSLSHLDPGSQPPLHPIDQCILLSLCLNIKNTSPSHGLTAEQMSPYVARVISHPRNWSIHTMALLLRSRLEANRTRTIERSTLQLQALVDQMPTADSTVSERLLYIHSIPLPSKWEVEKELAMRFLSLGVVKSALEIFERLEMWEEVVMCWQSMEKREKGITVVRDLLEGRKAEANAVISRNKMTMSTTGNDSSTPPSGTTTDTDTNTKRQTMDAAREAKLWCLLGDLEPEHAEDHYTYAWTVSKETSGRAMRALGGYYFARGDYPNAISSLRKAVAINPLLARSWFVLGCAYVREEQWEGARDAFARCVTIDDEDGESWNNLASVYLRMGEASQKVEVVETDDNTVVDQQESANLTRISDDSYSGEIHVPYSNKMLAFLALKQGLKFNYENWRMWNNYMIVAMDVGELSEACRALGRVVEERSAKDGASCVDEDVLERLVNAVAHAEVNDHAHGGVQGSNTTTRASASSTSSNSDESHGLLRLVNDLFDRIIIPRVSSPRIFRACAKLFTCQGRWEDALNAYLEAYRCGTAATIEKGETEVGKWREGVKEVEETIDVLRNFGPRIEGFKWRLQARSITRTFMARTKDFEDEPEWSRLTDLLEEIRKE